MKLPSMPFFPADFFADTLGLSGEEQAVYLLMLAHAWLRDGKLPSDEKALLKLLRIHGNHWNSVKKSVLPFWHTFEDSTLFNQRLLRDSREIQLKIETNKMNGKLGGRPPKSLKFNGVEKANGFYSGTQTKGNQNYNQNYNKESLNGGSQEKARETAELVFVKEETDQWNAWTEFYRKSKRHSPNVTCRQETHERGWYFPSEWPPSEQRQQHPEP